MASTGTLVAQKHDWRVTDADFEKATVALTETAHEAVQTDAAGDGSESLTEPATAGSTSVDGRIPNCTTLQMSR